MELMPTAQCFSLIVRIIFIEFREAYRAQPLILGRKRIIDLWELMGDPWYELETDFVNKSLSYDRIKPLGFELFLVPLEIS